MSWLACPPHFMCSPGERGCVIKARKLTLINFIRAIKKHHDWTNINKFRRGKIVMSDIENWMPCRKDLSGCIGNQLQSTTSARCPTARTAISPPLSKGPLGRGDRLRYINILFFKQEAHDLACFACPDQNVGNWTKFITRKILKVGAISWENKYALPK